jgi:hypothetical protein
MRPATVLIVGLGELGGIVLELLARIPDFAGRLLAADVAEDLGRRRTNSAIQGAAQCGLYPEIAFLRLDLSDVEGTAAALRRLRPDLVFNATTLASWWVRSLLPRAVHDQLYSVGAGAGAWTAMHLALAAKLMQAVGAAGIAPIVVNASYPDVVNAVLHRVGLAPAVGVGNVDLAGPAIRQVAGPRLGVSMRDVDVRLVAHHFHSFNLLYLGHTHGVPFHLEVTAAGRDVTSTLVESGLLAAIPDDARLPKGAAATYIVAASACRTILGILRDTGEIGHAPGPTGHPGGYPVRLSRKGVELALPPSIPLDRAIALNEGGQRAEGVERIESDGTVVFTETAHAVLRDVVGFQCRSFRVEEAEPVARELGARLRELGERFGVRLPVH